MTFDLMHRSHIHLKSSGSRYSAKHMAKPVNFYCVAPKAHAVTIAGEFNHWDAKSHPLKRQPDGTWTVQLQLTHGHHRYLFHVDGKVTLDPRASGTTRDTHHEKVSLISVS